MVWPSKLPRLAMVTTGAAVGVRSGVVESGMMVYDRLLIALIVRFGLHPWLASQIEWSALNPRRLCEHFQQFKTMPQFLRQPVAGVFHAGRNLEHGCGWLGQPRQRLHSFRPADRALAWPQMCIEIAGVVVDMRRADAFAEDGNGGVNAASQM